MLKGVPVDTFFDVMGMFASSMGEGYHVLHVKQAALRPHEIRELTPRITRARQMIAMMNTLSKELLQGEPRVTCYTYHRGTNSPVTRRLSVQYGVPMTIRT